MTQRAQCSTVGCDKPAKFILHDPQPLTDPTATPVFTCDDHVSTRIEGRIQVQAS